MKKENEMGYIKAFGHSLVSNSIDPAIDIAEIPVDAMIDDEFLKEFPVVKIFYAAGKTIASLRSLFLVKKTVAFIQEFQKGAKTQKDVQKYLDKHSGSDEMQKELETVLMYLDLCTHVFQSKLFARFYVAYLNRDFTWEVFQEIAEANRRMFIGDYNVLQMIVSGRNAYLPKTDEESSINRLLSLGLISDSRLKAKKGSVLVTEDYQNPGITLTEFGKVFGKYIDEIDFDRKTQLKRVFDESRYIGPKETEQGARARDKMIMNKINNSSKEEN